METTLFNIGCGLIATAPVVAGHFIFHKQIRYILISWFSSFVSTLLMVFGSLASLGTNNPWLVTILGVLLDCAGKVLLKFFTCRMKFLDPPSSRISLGFGIGMGYALAHVLTLYLPIVFDQIDSVDMDTFHTQNFPISLDLAVGYHASSVFHMGTSLLLVRFSTINPFIAYFVLVVLHYGYFGLSMIPVIWVKLLIMMVLSYASVVFGVILFRSMKYISTPEEIQDDPPE